MDPASASLIPPGTILAGKYQIAHVIWRDTVACLYHATNVDIARQVTIKVLARQLTKSAIQVERFLREARAADAIRSSYICDIYDSGKLDDGGLFLVLEPLIGENLYQRLTEIPWLDSATTTTIVSQVCRGLTKAHAAEVIHRNLKPENVFLTTDDDGALLAKILDFGLCKFYPPGSPQTRLTREGAVFGTPAYMSPEQVRGQGSVDHRADLWALGCIVYECLTRRTVWSTDQGAAMTFAQIANAPLPRPATHRPDLPVAFTAWFDKALNRDIEHRFQSAAEMAEAFAAVFAPRDGVQAAPIEVFISYAPKDEAFRRELDAHLSLLVRQGVVHAWYDRKIGAGEDRRKQTEHHLERAKLVLLLVSADFLASDYPYDVEMLGALERERAGTVRVIPVIARPCDWETAPFGHLAALPAGGRPVASWPSLDEAWTDVTRGIREALRPSTGGVTTEGDDLPAPRPRRPLPNVTINETRALALAQLELAHVRRNKLRAARRETGQIDREILALRRQVREGGRLHAGDSLGDGRYLLEKELGHGGFATVWLALDRERNHDVAIKVLHTNLASDPQRLERFRRGARIMEQLQHAAVVRVLEPEGEDGGFHYFVMEYLPRGDLRRAVLDGRLPREQALAAILRVSEALIEAHAKGIAHRDIKPANILLDERGEVKLTDFDLVVAADTTGGTRTGVLGTFLYAAPELLEEPRNAGPAADVYGLGMSAIFGLRGVEWTSQSIYERHRVVAGLSCGPAIRRTLSRAVAHDPAARFADADALRAALQYAIDTPVGLWASLRMWFTR